LPTTIALMLQISLAFWKMNGLGNQIVVVDARNGVARITGEQAEAIGAQPGLAFDQLMVIEASDVPELDASVRIFNSDGSPAGACGNGMRCVGLVLQDLTGADTFKCLVGEQIVMVRVSSREQIAVDMGRPRFDWSDIPLAEEFRDTRYIELQIGPIDAPILHSPSVANVGNPHAVFWIEDVDGHDLAASGPMLENHPIFPDRANISIAQVLAPDHIKLRTWERGAGLTQACGSAACAAAVCGARTRRTGRTVVVNLAGGDLTITWQDNDRIVMTGPAELEFNGTVELTEGSATVTSRTDTLA